MGKALGSDRQDQAAFLLYYLRKLYPQQSHISVCVDDFDEMKDYSTLECAKESFADLPSIRRASCQDVWVVRSNDTEELPQHAILWYSPSA